MVHSEFRKFALPSETTVRRKTLKGKLRNNCISKFLYAIDMNLNLLYALIVFSIRRKKNHILIKKKGWYSLQVP